MITLPGTPISVNKRLILNKRVGRFANTRAYAELKSAWSWHVKSQWRRKPLTRALSLEINFWYPNRRHDIDNGIKIVLDVLSNLVYEDDKQIDELIVHKKLDKENPRVEIEVYGEEEE